MCEGGYEQGEGDEDEEEHGDEHEEEHEHEQEHEHGYFALRTSHFARARGNDVVGWGVVTYGMVVTCKAIAGAYEESF